MIYTVDFETRSTVELKRSSVYPYAKHRDTGIWCMAYAADDQLPRLWFEGEPFPEELAQHVAAGGLMVAHNAAFERVMWRDCAELRYGWPAVRFDQWRDTAAEAAAMSLPRSLDKLAKVLKLGQKKDMEGHKLMQRMCRPRRFDDATGEPVWWDEPAKVKRLGEYCAQDIAVEQLVYKALRRLNARELAIYQHHELVNDRGVQLDQELARRVQAMATHEIARQNQLLQEATAGEVEEVTKVAKLKDWLRANDIVIPTVVKKNQKTGKMEEKESLGKAALRELMDDSVKLSPDVKAALDARAEASKSSLAKVGAMFDVLNTDGRMRGLLLYHGAGTGRTTGKHVQPHNFPRGNAVKDVLGLVQFALDGRLAEVLAATEGSPSLMTVLSAMLRPMLVAAPGRILMCADFASIEARIVGWLAGQDDMTEMFRSGANLYKEMGAVIFDRPASEIVKPSDDYTISKNTVLGCGFSMGAKRFRAQLKEQGGVEVTEELAEKAVGAYRERFFKIPQYWRDVNDAAVEAVLRPGEIQRVGVTKFVQRGSYLWIILPAGRSLAYAEPRVVERPVPWGGTKPAVEFAGENPFTRQWERLALYGGLITENITQAIARDVMEDAAARTEAEGFPTVLTVHDEVVAEVDSSYLDGGAKYERFLELMRVVPTWAAGLPVEVEGWVGERYRK